jgi:hypothetical protein
MRDDLKRTPSKIKSRKNPKNIEFRTLIFLLQNTHELKLVAMSHGKN